MLQGNGAYPELTRAYIQGIVGVVSGIVNSVELDDDPERKVWIVADEFAQMGKIPVRPLFEVGRSRGVRCIVACQDFAQLEEVHGKEGTRALVSMCGTLMVGRVGPGETAETLSRNLGNREVERSNVSTSFDGKAGSSAPTTTLTYSRDSLALYVPTELSSRLGDKPALKGCVFAVAVQGKVFEILWPYFQMPKKRKAHVPAPWTLESSAASLGQPVKRPAPNAAGLATFTGVTTGTQSRVSQGSHADSIKEAVSQKTGLQQAAQPQGSFSKSPVTVVTAGTGQEPTCSHDPAEEAARLALKAIEMLKARAGPLERGEPNNLGQPPGQ